jgi:hypothetical protein
MTEDTKNALGDMIRMVAPFIVGLVIGVLGDMLHSQTTFVLKEDYERDRVEMRERMVRIEDQLNEVLDRLPKKD